MSAAEARTRNTSEPGEEGDVTTRRQPQPQVVNAGRVKSPAGQIEVRCACGRWTLQARFCSWCGQDLRLRTPERVG